jgi:putative ABC transport system substrate-binding protein
MHGRGRTRAAADQADLGEQLENGKGARPHRSAINHGAGGPGDRVITRRKIVLGLASLLASAKAALAQQPKKVARIGYFSNQSGRSSSTEALQKGLQELGYVQGRNIDFEWRFSEGQIDRLASIAAEMVRLGVDVLVVTGIAPALAARQATATIPIVMTNASDDPVRRGLAASLAHPGGNVTGLVDIAEVLTGKRLELLKQILPRAMRIGVLWHPESPAATRQARGVQAAARVLGLEVQTFEVWQADEIETALNAVANWRADGLYVPHFGGLFVRHQARILDLIRKLRIPAMYTDIAWVDAGGLIGYAPDTVDQARRAATYVDKILKGAKPGELPIERPTKFEMAVNLKTAKALGLNMPPEIMVQATRVIQ